MIQLDCRSIPWSRLFVYTSLTLCAGVCFWRNMRGGSAVPDWLAQEDIWRCAKRRRWKQRTILAASRATTMFRRTAQQCGSKWAGQRRAGARRLTTVRAVRILGRPDTAASMACVRVAAVGGADRAEILPDVFPKQRQRQHELATPSGSYGCAPELRSVGKLETSLTVLSRSIASERRSELTRQTGCFRAREATIGATTTIASAAV